jgi:hypothetical protein
MSRNKRHVHHVLVFVTVFEMRDKTLKIDILATPEDSIFLVHGWCHLSVKLVILWI